MPSLALYYSIEPNKVNERAHVDANKKTFFALLDRMCLCVFYVHFVGNFIFLSIFPFLCESHTNKKKRMNRYRLKLSHDAAMNAQR